MLRQLREKLARNRLADVFVYVGKLDDIAAQVRRLLRRDGLWAFSVEGLEFRDAGARSISDAEFKLNATGRYAHSKGYLDALASRDGLTLLACQRVCIRMDEGKPVEGYLVPAGLS